MKLKSRLPQVRVCSAIAILAITGGLAPGVANSSEALSIPQHKGTAMSNDLLIPNTATSVVPAEAASVIAFWQEAGPSMWFAKEAVFDRRFRERFLAAHETAAAGALSHWRETPQGALALVILLDQFPRNAFRGTARMYATDDIARHIADEAIRNGFDLRVEKRLSLFLYLPFAHSENRADQERSVALVERLGEPDLSHATHHRDIVLRFARFPHRNPILGREMRPEEQRFLDEGGFAG